MKYAGALLFAVALLALLSWTPSAVINAKHISSSSAHESLLLNDEFPTMGLEDEWYAARRAAAEAEGTRHSHHHIRPARETMNLTKLDLETYPMAKCIDGSPGAFYHLPAPAGSTHPNTWVFYFKGGGWCVDPEGCYYRSKSELGSSTKYAEKMYASDYGYMGRDAAHNPEFYDAHIIWMPYCDGFSFMGSREDTLETTDPETGANVSLYFRGSYIRKAILETISKTIPDFTSGATEVLISGSSAGGLATFLHTTSVAQWLNTNLMSTTLKIRSMPLSGYFLNTNNAAGVPAYGMQMQKWFEVVNASADVDPGCKERFESEDISQCIFAHNVYETQKVPTFVLNSQMDAWQGQCIVMGNATGGVRGRMSCLAFPEYDKCMDSLGKHNASACTSYTMKPFLRFERDFRMRVANRTSNFHATGHGAFITSCYLHVENLGTYYNKVFINGVSAQKAVSNWWASSESEPAFKHTHLDCFNSDEKPFLCNPTCTI